MFKKIKKKEHFAPNWAPPVFDNQALLATCACLVEVYLYGAVQRHYTAAGIGGTFIKHKRF